ncbi:hypothetical protein P7K49_022948, partial [Saguinus oedipus]
MMQHPLTGATCVALPNVGMCPQLSCALTFMYLQQFVRVVLYSVRMGSDHLDFWSVSDPVSAFKLAGNAVMK